MRNLFFNGFHPVFPWLALLLFGIWLGRKKLANIEVRRDLLWKSLLIAILIQALSCYLLEIVVAAHTAGVITGDDQEFFQYLLATQPMPPAPLYLMLTSAISVVVICVCIEMGLVFSDAWIVRWLSVTGQLALTLYLAHVLLGMAFLEEIGRLENQTLLFSVLSAAIFSLLAIGFSVVWRRYFRRGPAECLMRNLAG